MALKVPMLTATALVCFAGNSLLCRLALAERHIDAATFTALRLASGALVLALLVIRRRRDATPSRANWSSALFLFAYAAPFSFAYLRLGAAMGALVLFASVQVTMIGWGVVRGERPTVRAWLGVMAAIAGLAALTIPGITAPDPVGTAWMAAAGIAWGAYSLRGRMGGSDPLVVTAGSFVRTLPFVAILVVAALVARAAQASTRGVLLAILSGVVASGFGYAIWYAVLPTLGATRAAVLQLLVPVIASAGAMMWLGEDVTLRFVLGSSAILGGVAVTIFAGKNRPRTQSTGCQRALWQSE